MNLPMFRHLLHKAVPTEILSNIGKCYLTWNHARFPWKHNNNIELIFFFLHLRGAVPICEVNHSLRHLRGPDISLSSTACHYISDGCNLQASGCISCPPLVKIASVFLRPSLQLLHWKQRNVCGQDDRGQAAEGIWHPSETWFWRYVEMRGYRGGCLHAGPFARCYLQVIHLKFVRKGGLRQNTGNGCEDTTTMSLLCISSYIEDGCSSGSRTHTQESNQFFSFFFFLKQGQWVHWILIFFF